MKKWIEGALWGCALGLVLVRPLLGQDAPSEKRARPTGKTLLPGKQETGPAVSTPAGQTAAPTQSRTTPPEEESTMDVTVTGEARDEIPVVLDAPPLDVPLKEVVGLSRDGQTDRVLTAPVEHIGGGELLSLTLLPPRQILGALPVSLPTPPFVQMELAPGLNAAAWDFRVLDEENQMIHREEGTRLPKDLIVWDGLERGQLKIKVGRVYTPLLILTSLNGKIERYYGEPVLYDALQFRVGNAHRTEFSNLTLFGKGSSEFSPEAGPFLRALLNNLRRVTGAPVRVTVFSSPNESPLAAARAAAWRTLLTDALVMASEGMIFETAPETEERGAVTQVQWESVP